MVKDEAAEIIENMIQAIIDNPRQFHINIKVIGQQVTSHGGTGLRVNATGGGPGSTTIGQVVSADGSQIQIAQERAGRAIDQQFEALIETLNKICEQLKSNTPDRALISRLYNSLKSTWVPGVIVSVVGTIISKVLGL